MARSIYGYQQVLAGLHFRCIRKHVGGFIASMEIMSKAFGASARVSILGSGRPVTTAKGQFSLIGYVSSRLARAPVRKALMCAILFIRYRHELSNILQSKQGSTLQRFVEARPEVRELVLAPYLAANWDVPTRLARIADHCATVEAMGGLVDFPPDQIVYVLQLNTIDPRYRLSLCQARWLLRDGQMIFSLWDDIHRIFNVAFCLSSSEGKLIAYVGAIQGRMDTYSNSGDDDRKFDVLERYRHFTKAASGIRPRDFIVEAFKAFCQALGVVEIRAVSDGNRRLAADEIKLSYDEIWRERGGTDNGKGFFVLPATAGRRADEDIPAKKRAMYRKRYAIMSMVEAGLAQQLGVPPRHVRDRVGMQGMPQMRSDQEQPPG